MSVNNVVRDAVGFSPAGSHAWTLYEQCRTAWRMVGRLAAEPTDEWQTQLTKATELDGELRDALRGLK